MKKVYILIVCFKNKELIVFIDIVSISVQFSFSVMSISLQPHGLQHTRLPCTSTDSQSLCKLMSIESVMPSKHLVLCRPLLLLPSVFIDIRVFSEISSRFCLFFNFLFRLKIFHFTVFCHSSFLFLRPSLLPFSLSSFLSTSSPSLPSFSVYESGHFLKTV